MFCSAELELKLGRTVFLQSFDFGDVVFCLLPLLGIVNLHLYLVFLILFGFLFGINLVKLIMSEWNLCLTQGWMWADYAEH